MDILFTIPLCLTKDATENTSPTFSDNYYSNSIDGPETMFTPYVSLLSEDKDEPEKAQPINDSSNGLFNIVEKMNYVFSIT
jgi:hypothetical protein